MGKPLREKTGLAVIDGGEASIKLAEIAVELGLKPNRLPTQSTQRLIDA